MMLILLVACDGPPEEPRVDPLRVEPRFLSQTLDCPVTLTLPAGEPYMLRVLESTGDDTGVETWEAYPQAIRFWPGQELEIPCDTGERLRVTYGWWMPDY